MSIIAPKSGLYSLAEARAWLAGLGLGEAPARPAAPPLTADLVITTAIPPHPVARHAGWAVAAEATLGASPYGPVPLAGLRGVAAGDAMPAGTDAVLPPEHGSNAGPWGEVTASVAHGEGVVAAGAHLAAGQVLGRAGEPDRLLARLLAAAKPGAMCRLLAAITPSGIVLGPVAQPVIAGLAARPIEDTTFGHDEQGQPAIALPADPAALLLAWCALLAGPGTTVQATLTRKLPSGVGVSDIVAVRLAGGLATPLTAADAPSLAALAQAAGWVETMPASEGYAEGAEVAVLLFPAAVVG